MKLKKLTNLLQVVSVVLIFLVVFYIFSILPNKILDEIYYEGFFIFFMPLLLELIPIIIVILISIKIYENIGNNKIFVKENTRLIRFIKNIIFFAMIITFLDIIITAGLTIYELYPDNLMFWKIILFNKHFYIFEKFVYFLVLIIVYVFIKILLYLIKNGVELQEDQDLTV